MAEEGKTVRGMNSGEISQSTNSLRFVERDGKKILQQLWVYRGANARSEWRDVPVEKETQ